MSTSPHQNDAASNHGKATSFLGGTSFIGSAPDMAHIMDRSYQSGHRSHTVDHRGNNMPYGVNNIIAPYQATSLAPNVDRIEAWNDYISQGNGSNHESNALSGVVSNNQMSNAGTNPAVAFYVQNGAAPAASSGQNFVQGGTVSAVTSGQHLVHSGAVHAASSGQNSGFFAGVSSADVSSKRSDGVQRFNIGSKSSSDNYARSPRHERRNRQSGKESRPFHRTKIDLLSANPNQEQKSISDKSNSNDRDFRERVRRSRHASPITPPLVSPTTPADHGLRSASVQQQKQVGIIVTESNPPIRSNSVREQYSLNHSKASGITGASMIQNNNIDLSLNNNNRVPFVAGMPIIQNSNFPPQLDAGVVYNASHFSGSLVGGPFRRNSPIKGPLNTNRSVTSQRVNDICANVVRENTKNLASKSDLANVATKADVQNLIVEAMTTMMAQVKLDVKEVVSTQFRSQSSPPKEVRIDTNIQQTQNHLSREMKNDTVMQNNNNVNLVSQPQLNTNLTQSNIQQHINHIYSSKNNLNGGAIRSPGRTNSPSKNPYSSPRPLMSVNLNNSGTAAGNMFPIRSPPGLTSSNRVFNQSVTQGLLKCVICGNMDHVAEVCPHRYTSANHQGYSYTGPLCTVCNSYGHLAYECPENNRCTVCAKYGHMSDVCPEKYRQRSNSNGGRGYQGPKCTICGQFGHLAAACPKRVCGLNNTNNITKKYFLDRDAYCRHCGKPDHHQEDCPKRKGSPPKIVRVSGVPIWNIGTPGRKASKSPRKDSADLGSASKRQKSVNKDNFQYFKNWDDDDDHHSNASKRSRSGASSTYSRNSAVSWFEKYDDDSRSPRRLKSILTPRGGRTRTQSPRRVTIRRPRSSPPAQSKSKAYCHPAEAKMFLDMFTRPTEKANPHKLLQTTKSWAVACKEGDVKPSFITKHLYTNFKDYHLTSSAFANLPFNAKLDKILGTIERALKTAGGPEVQQLLRVLYGCRRIKGQFVSSFIDAFFNCIEKVSRLGGDFPLKDYNSQFLWQGGPPTSSAEILNAMTERDTKFKVYKNKVKSICGTNNGPWVCPPVQYHQDGTYSNDGSNYIGNRHNIKKIKQSFLYCEQHVSTGNQKQHQGNTYYNDPKPKKGNGKQPKKTKKTDGSKKFEGECKNGHNCKEFILTGSCKFYHKPLDYSYLRAKRDLAKEEGVETTEANYEKIKNYKIDSYEENIKATRLRAADEAAAANTARQKADGAAKAKAKAAPKKKT